MGRIRSIKPDLFLDDRFHDVECEACEKHGLPLYALRLFWIGLWTQADREGRFKWRPKRLKLQLFPYDDIDVGVLLQALTSGRYIKHYLIDGQEVGAICDWHQHQRVRNDELKSALPPPSDSCKYIEPKQVQDDVTNPSRRSDEPVTSTSPTHTVEGEGEGERERERKGKKRGRRAGQKPDPVPIGAYTAIVEAYNERAETNCRPTSETYKRLIRARWKDGFRELDFVKVLENMRWWLRDDKMSKYYRMETLFGTKFETYLNTPRHRPPGGDYGKMPEVFD